MHEVQNLGAVQTYIKRYLYVNAFEIVEQDAIDKSQPESRQKTEPTKRVRPFDQSAVGRVQKKNIDQDDDPDTMKKRTERNLLLLLVMKNCQRSRQQNTKN